MHCIHWCTIRHYVAPSPYFFVGVQAAVYLWLHPVCHLSVSATKSRATWHRRSRCGSRMLQGRVSNASERGTGGWAPSGWGLCPFARKILYFLYQNGKFSCMFWKYVLFKKGTLITRAGVWTPWTAPGSASAKMTNGDNWTSSSPSSYHWCKVTHDSNSTLIYSKLTSFLHKRLVQATVKKHMLIIYTAWKTCSLKVCHEENMQPNGPTLTLSLA